jgi:hypothetical protein
MRRWRRDGCRRCVGDTASTAPLSSRSGPVERRPPSASRSNRSDQFLAAQHADQAPYGVIVDRGALPRPPYEADDREARCGVAVEQILAVALRIGRHNRSGQPVVGRDQPREEGAAFRQDRASSSVRSISAARARTNCRSRRCEWSTSLTVAAPDQIRIGAAVGLDAEVAQQNAAQGAHDRGAVRARRSVIRSSAAMRPRSSTRIAVGERHRFLDVVRDEQYSRAMLLPQREHQGMHLEPGQRIQRSKRLVEQQQFAARGSAPGRARRAALRRPKASAATHPADARARPLPAPSRRRSDLPPGPVPGRARRSARRASTAASAHPGTRSRATKE